MLTPMVVPSGSALATSSVPVLPLAPGLFSTMKVCPVLSCKFSATMRATRSGVAPAANGTMIWTVLVGQSCADADSVPSRTANTAPRLRFIAFSSASPVALAWLDLGLARCIQTYHGDDGRRRGEQLCARRQN